MEIKDLNNVSQNLFVKNNVTNVLTSSVLGAGFADLLNQTTDGILQKAESMVDPDIKIGPENNRYDEIKAEADIKNTDSKENVSTNKESPAKDADKKADGKKDVVDEKNNEKPVKNKKEKTADVAAENVQNVQGNQNPVSEDEKASGTLVSDGAAEVKEAESISADAQIPTQMVKENFSNVLQPQIELKNLVEQNPQIVNEVIQSLGVDVVVNEFGFALADESMNLQALAGMPEVTVLNADGKIQTMSGEALVNKLQSIGVDMKLPQISLPEAMGGIELPQEIVSEFVRMSEGSGKQISVSADNINTANKVTYNDENIALQAVSLDEKVAVEKPLKVSVEIKDEKASVSSDGQLIENTLELAEAVDAVEGSDKQSFVKQGEGEHSLRLSGKENAQSSIQNNNIGNPSNAYAAVNNAAGVTEQVADVSGKIAGKEMGAFSNSSSGNAAHSALMGNEFAQVAKNEGAKNPVETSFRDIYKGMSREAVEQVKVNITKSAVKGTDKIDIQLKPEDLGHIQIKMQIKDGKLQAHIIASRPETMDMLQKEVQSLERAFNDAGFETDEGSLTFSFNKENQSGQESDGNTKLRHFIGEMLENETSEEMANDNWSYTNGVNIRV